MDSIRTLLLPLLMGILSLASNSLCFGATAEQEPTKPYWPTNGWQTSTPEEQGMDSSVLAHLFEDFDDSLLVIRHGKIIAEAYRAPFEPGMKHKLNSATKSVVGTLVEIAIQKGNLDSTEHHILNLFSEKPIANVDENKKAITVQHLLDMTSGLDWPDEFTNMATMIQMIRSPDWAQFILDRPMAEVPGIRFNYNSGGSHLLSAIVSKTTGMSALEFANRQLFGPLGITNVTWPHDPQGISRGGEGLFLQPRDMAKIGYLYLHNGMWDGKQILSPAWVDKIKHSTVDMNMGMDLHYANQWWTIPSKNAYMAIGNDAQIILVLPEHEVVAVMTGASFYSFTSLVEGIIAAVKSDVPLPANPDGLAALAMRVKEAAQEVPSPVGKSSPLAKVISGKTYQFSDNEFKIKSLKLDLAVGKPSFELNVGSSLIPGYPPRQTGPIGLDGFFRKGNPIPEGMLKGMQPVRKGAWVDEHTFVIEWGVGGGRTWLYTLIFKGNKVDMTCDWLGQKLEAHGEWMK